ncbi:MAG TPA: SPOR domain-containing protein [Luteimonas sp.]|nr:SPOR domain-containing protein [Luteimonas sp.]
MDSGLKQRLIGAAVLVALGVIFLPMLVQGPAPDSGVSDVPLLMPDAPAGNYETRDLPLVTPGTTPDGGAVGMQSTLPIATPPAADGDALPTVDTATAVPSASAAVALGDAGATAAAPLPPPKAATGTMFPAATAGGDYAVHFGSFTSSASADQVVASLRASQLPGYREQGLVDGKPVWRVRIGPYATRADAEAARLRAAHVRDDVGARVIALDADVATPAAATTAAATATPVAAKPIETPKPVETPPVMPPTAAAGTGFAVQLAAFSKPADAAALRDKVRAAGFSAFTESVSTDKGTLTRVRVGPVASRAEADALKVQVKAKVGVDGIVRPHP